MASIDSSLVRDDIKMLVSISQGMKKRVKAVFKQLENSPGSFLLLAHVAPGITDRYNNLIALRKAKITGKNHDFRMIFAHWALEDDREHVDILLVFPRQDGYRIDWEWMLSQLDDQ